MAKNSHKGHGIMRFKEAKRVILDDLDNARTQYEELYQSICCEWGTFDSEKDASCALISSVEDLVDSIRHTPFSIAKNQKMIAHEMM